jgi:hypothetical protein
VKTLLICHEGATLDQQGLARWLASFSDLVGLIVLREKPQRMWRRIRREWQRVGSIRFLDVLAFRLYYRLFLAEQDRRWEAQRLSEIRHVYPEVSQEVPVLYTHSPNTPEAERFIKELAPDMMLARCKTLLKESIFSLPSKGTYVMHPGICPEYRNAHGCFWALASDDLENVGMTLLRIDKGVDTGPTYGYYRYQYDEVHESHIVIQHRVVHENLDALQTKLTEIYDALARPVDVHGRASATWGQPWLTSYLKWKFRARRRNRKRGNNESHFPALP